MQGPYEIHEIESLIEKDPTSLIWGRGLSEWVGSDKWKEHIKDEKQNPPEPPTEPQWKYRYGQKEFGPMPYPELIHQLKKISDPQYLTLWSDEFNEWREIYLVNKVADELGVSRRNHPRVPIMGTLHCDIPKGAIDIKVISISEGGLGAGEASQLEIGEKFKGVLTSPNLFISLNCVCEVMHIGKDGYAGIRFTNLPIEAKSAVIEYVNKFKMTHKSL